LIEIRDLRFSYGKGYVLRDINLEIHGGKLVFLLGPNGAGKSTLLKCLAGILPYEGSIKLYDRELREIPRQELSKLVGYIPQMTEIAYLTVFDVVLTGRRPHFDWGPSKKDLEVVWEVLRSLNIDHLAFRNLSELSGGELQLAMIARALAQEPKIMLLDEPTSNLDLKNQVLVLRKVREIIESGMVSIAIISTHDVNLAASYADEIVLLKEGSIKSFGPVSEVLREDVISEAYGIKVSTFNVDGKMFISVE